MLPRPWTTPRPAALAPPDAFLHRRLALTDAWLDDAGTWRPIQVADASTLWSILGYLRWHARLLMACDPDGGAFAGDADAYLAARPIVAAIDEELSARGEVPRGTALDVLRSLGFAPWELPSTTRPAIAAADR